MKDRGEFPLWILACAGLCAASFVGASKDSQHQKQIEQLQDDVETLGAAIRMLDQRLDDTALCWPVLP